ncbi:MAG: Ig-like domain-containing protein [Myxococcota bacterium]|nr:Ig-like domain-containing protein [Myxococcota bacterium]
MSLGNVAQDDPDPAGKTVAQIIASAGGDRITDLDPGDLEGIAVIGVDDANGTWQYSVDGGSSWLSFVAGGVLDGGTDDTQSILLGEDDLVRFVPAPTYTGSAGSVSFRAWDQSDGLPAGMTGVDASVTGGSTAFSTATESFDAQVVTVQERALWFSTRDDISDGGTPGVNSWTEGEILELAGGAFSIAFDLDAFVADGDADIDAIHLVQNDITLGSANAVGLLAGDLLLSTNNSEVVGGLAVTSGAVFVFRPDGPSYDSGSFLYLLDSAGFGGGDIEDFALVEQATTVGGMALSAGSLILGDGAEDIVVFTPTDVGAGTTTGTLATLVEGLDIGLEAGNEFRGIELIHTPTEVNGVLLDEGSLLVSLRVNGLVGDNALNVKRNDVLVLDVTQAGSDSEATASFVLDGSSLGLGGGDESVRPIGLAPLNTAPTLTPGAPTLTTITEDDVANPGDLVSDILSGLVSDPDAGSVTGLAVTGLSTGNGVWEFSTDGGGVWNAVGAVSNTSALLLRDVDRIRYVPDGLDADSADFSFRAWDQTDGLPGDLHDTSTNGGFSAFSANTDVAHIDVLPVNDAPVGADNTVSTLEDAPYVFQLADFGFDDPVEGHGFQAIQLAGLVGAGTLTNGGVVLTGVELIDAADIAAGDLVFTPVPDANGAAHGGFSFQVQDSGGTANGGVDLDPVARLMTVDVTSVNDEPSGSDATIVLLEDDSHTFGVADFGFGDAADGDSLAAIVITTAPGAGTLRNGATVLAGGETVTVAQILAGDLVYTPDPDDNGTAHASFTFQVMDDGGTANGGVELDATPNTIQLDVTPVNDAPDGTDATIVMDEDSSHVFGVADFGFDDALDGDSLASVVISTAPGAGTLRNGATVLTGGETVTVAQILAGDLVFTPDPGDSGVAYASFTFQVRDDGGTANGGIDLDPTPNTIQLDVTSINDAPDGTDATIALLEDGAHVFGVADFGFSDADGDSLAAVVITTAPGAGTLRNGATTLTGGETVTVAQILAGDLVFTPDPDDNGVGYASFGFQVKDDGGTANGGVDLDATPNTIQLDVTPVNDVPAGTDVTVTTGEDTGYVFTVADFGLNDPLDGDALLEIVVTTAPAAGTLTNGVTVLTGGETVSAAAINAGDLVFTPLPGENGVGYASFDFQVRDDGGTANGGVDLDPTPNTVTIDVTAVNNAPSGADATLNVLEDVPYTFALGDFGFSDPADGHSLLAVEIGVVAGAGTFRDGALVLTGGETVTAGSIASGNLTYTPVPGASGAGQATLTFQVRDSGGTANGGVDLDPTPNTLTLDVLAVNDAPSGSDDNITILEDGAHTLTLGDFGFSDGDGNALASVVITTAPGAGTLRNGATVLTGGETVTRAQILAGDLVYTAPPDANGPSLASFGFQVVDDGGTANGGVDTDPTANTIDFDVTAVNDEPSGTDATCTLLEDGSHTFGVADFGFSDVVEGDSLSGVFITTVPGAGTLRNGASVLAGGETVTVAQILAGDLVYTPAPDDNGVAAASFTFQVIDDGGTANGGVDMDSTPNTIQLDITPVNDAPSGTDSNVVLLEDGSHVFAVGDFAITDPEGHGLSAVVITTAPGAGTLRNGATVLTGGETVTGAQIAAGDLVYTPAPGASGVGASSFTFQVVDDGGTANGGVDTDPTANTMRLDVTAVNDAPSGTDRTISLLEDASHTFGTADFGFGDTDGNALAGVVITTAPGAGTLRNGATTLTGGETVTLAQILAGDVVYTPDPDDNGTGLASFTFQVIDDGGVANGGVDTDPTPNTIQLDVAPVNDAPSGTDTTLSLSEDGSLTFGLSDFGFSDAIDGDAFAAVRIASGPTDGTLRNGAIVLTGGETVTATSIAAGDLVFTPDADESGLGYASFGFQVQDDGGVANGGVDLDPTVNTVTLDVLAANDAPVLASASPNLTAINENATGNAGQTVASVVGASITDSDPAPSEGVALTRIASSGGTWQYSTNGGGSWNVVGAVSDASALLLRDSDRIRFVPDAQNGETASFDFRAWDQTSGVFGTHANTTTNGGATAFSTSDNRATISVASVNDAPGLGNATMPSIEAGTTDPAGASVAALFGGRFSDVDAGSSMSGVAVIGNAAAAAQGVWQYSTDGGASWSSVGAVGDGVNALAISSATRLRFVPAAGFSGTPSALAVRALDDAYPGTFSTAGVAETRILVDTSAPGGSSAVSGSAASLAIDVTEAPGGSEEEEPEGETALPPTIDEEPPLSSPEVQEDPEIEVAAEPEGVDAATEASPDPVDLTGIAPRIVPTVDWGDPSPRVVSQGLPVVEVGEAREATPEEIERLDDRREPPTLASFGSSPSERIREFFRGLKDDLGFLNPETGFASELERLEEVRIEQARLEQTVVGSSVAMSAGLSIGYLVWLTRGGLLIASMASSIPVWRLVDPIPVLASLALGETDEDDAESLDSMLRESAGDGRPEAPETPTVRP